MSSKWFASRLYSCGIPPVAILTDERLHVTSARVSNDLAGRLCKRLCYRAKGHRKMKGTLHVECIAFPFVFGEVVLFGGPKCTRTIGRKYVEVFKLSSLERLIICILYMCVLISESAPPHVLGFIMVFRV